MEPVVLKTAVHVHFGIRDYKTVRRREFMLLMSLSGLIRRESEQGSEAQKSSVKLPKLKRTITKVKHYQINSTEDGKGAGVRTSEHVRIQPVKGVDQRVGESRLRLQHLRAVLAALPEARFDSEHPHMTAHNYLLLQF